MMIVVAIIGILAAVAVFMFRRTTNKAKSTEVRVMFTEMKSREEAYMTEFNTYKATAASDTDFHPATPAGADNKTSLAPMPDEWNELRITPGEINVHCSYLIRAGNANTACANCPVGNGVFDFNNLIPTAHWYYLLAECDWNGDPGANMYYFARSDREGVVTANDGM